MVSFFDKKILGRSCLIELKVDELNTGIAISSIEISSDTTEVKYFVDEFLEVIPLFNDELSTKRMTASVVGLIDKTFRKSNPRERLELKNAFLFEIRNSGRIDYPQIVDRVFRRFFSRSECPIPVAEANKFLDKVNKLPKDKGFANQFNPVPSAINKRIIKSSYNLGHGMELSIKEVDGVNLMNEVMAGYENDGRGYLKIYTDEEEALRTFRMN